MGTGKRIGYIRVSTVLQNTARQLDGIELDKVFTDKASGKDTNRPQLQACLEFIREGDTLIVHSMDRLARNVVDLRNIVADLSKKGVTVRFEKEGMTFAGDASPINNLLLTMLGGVAEFERALIRERQQEGIVAAKAKGDVYKGRKPALTPQQAAELIQRAKGGESKVQLAQEFGISRQAVYDYMKAAKAGASHGE